MFDPFNREAIGTTLTSTWQCPCGSSFSYELTVAASPVNPALTTTVQSWEDFRAGRVWFPEHRDHGRPVQL